MPMLDMLQMGLFFLFVIAFVTIIGGLGWLWQRAQATLPAEERYGYGRRRPVATTELAAERQVQLLSSENEKLTGKIGRLEERLAVVERIVTDPAERTAREIDALHYR